MQDPIIELEGLTKCYGSVKAVDNLSLKIGRGEIFGLRCKCHQQPHCRKAKSRVHARQRRIL